MGARSKWQKLQIKLTHVNAIDVATNWFESKR